MKILYVHSTDMSGRLSSLGSVRHIMEISENLFQLGHQITIIAPGYAKYTYKTKINIVYVPILKFRFVRSLLYEILCPIYMLIFFFFRKPDIVYWRQSYLTIFPVFISRLFQIKVVTEINGVTAEEVESEPLSSIRKKIILLIEKANYAASNHLICVSPRIKERLIEIYKLSGNKFTVILNGVNCLRLPVINKSKAKRTIGISPNLKIVGFVGHFFPWDGLEILIEAAAEVVNKMKDIRFLLVGQGKWGNHLKRLVKNKNLEKFFIFTGRVPWDKLFLYLNSFDIATAPYSKQIHKKSGSSLKILEYFACNKPVVASATESIPEILDIKKKRLGLTVEPENSKDLAKAILFLLNDRNLRKISGSGGRVYVEKERSWRIVAYKTSKKLKDVLMTS